MRATVSLAFVDFPGPFSVERITRIIEHQYSVRFDRDTPDYVIYSVFGTSHLRYNKSVRIFFTGENVHPDFNVCDYAFGFDWLEFGDRFYRCPNYALYSELDDLRVRRRTVLTPEQWRIKAQHFCNFIYSNADAHPARDRFFHLLEKYRRIDSAGRHLNNIGGPIIGAPYEDNWTNKKLGLQSKYRFSIAFENSSTPGYTTEKIVQALAADTIPIYWGNPLIGREFNTRRFINCHEFPSLDSVVARVREIDSNRALFEEILREPFFPDDVAPRSLLQSEIRKQLAYIFEQGPHRAIRRNHYCWGQKYEQRRLDEVAALAAVKAPGLKGKFLRRLFAVIAPAGNASVNL